jgi:hypothetical protein
MYHSSNTSTFLNIPEPQDRFLALWPHRWDFLYANLTHPEQTPNWNTESRYPLGDRAILAGGTLYGCRFGTETSYFMLDIDKGSVYHPKRDRFATEKILGALELLGITDHVAVTSSYRGGLHLYFPLPFPVLTWQLAAVVERVLSRKFYVEPGVLEIFPNVRQFEGERERLSLYNGHRLPLQEGSYLLNRFWELERSDHLAFTWRWEFAMYRNQINQVVFDRILQEVMEENKIRRLSHPAAKFLQDLNNDIAPGWTGHGQTNFILGRLALRSYVFGHVIEGCYQPLTGERLILDIVAKAQKLPGYTEHCRHQHEIYNRAEDWANCVEKSRRYYPYGRKDLHIPPEEPEQEVKGSAPNTWNEKQKTEARERLELSIAVLLHNDRLPTGIRERVITLCQDFHFSAETLYKHRDLWHPLANESGLWKTPPDPLNSSEPNGGACSVGAPPQTAQNLLSSGGCNPLQAVDWGQFLALLEQQTGCNTALGADSTQSDRVLPVDNYPDQRHDDDEPPG